jgi:hypothetical protein
MTRCKHGFAEIRNVRNAVRLCKNERKKSFVTQCGLFKRLSYGEPNAVENAIGYVGNYSRSHNAVIRVYDDTGNGGRPPLVAPNIERGAIPAPDAHSCVLGAPF